MFISGFGLLESGSVSSKNEVNIMVKNAVDVIFGGLTYWMLGYGLSFGEDEAFSTPFNGWGDFFVTANEDNLGWVYAKFFFQASFATTATTIVSGRGFCLVWFFWFVCASLEHTDFNESSTIGC